jgi:hypothetical protein
MHRARVRFRGLQARPIAQRAPRRVERDAHRGSLNERQSLRQRITLVRSDRDFLGITALLRRRQNAIADLQVFDIRPGRANDTGWAFAWREGQFRQELIGAGHDQRVNEIDLRAG